MKMRDDNQYTTQMTTLDDNLDDNQDDNRDDYTRWQPQLTT
jgi:hypothetical protein